MADSEEVTDQREQLPDIVSLNQVSSLIFSSEDLFTRNAEKIHNPPKFDTNLAAPERSAKSDFAVAEKPYVKEASTVTPVKFSTSIMEGDDFTFGIELEAASKRSEDPVSSYSSYINVLAENCKAPDNLSFFMERLALFKQPLPLFIKQSNPSAILKQGCGSIINIAIDKSWNSSIFLLASEAQPKSCYQWDEGNRGNCRQVLGVLLVKTEIAQGIPDSKKETSKMELVESMDDLALCQSSKEGGMLCIHICIFCGQGLIGGSPCGEVCHGFLKEKKFQSNEPEETYKNESLMEFSNKTRGKSLKEEGKKRRFFFGICPNKIKTKTNRPRAIHIENSSNITNEKKERFPFDDRSPKPKICFNYSPLQKTKSDVKLCSCHTPLELSSMDKEYEPNGAEAYCKISDPSTLPSTFRESKCHLIRQHLPQKFSSQASQHHAPVVSEGTQTTEITQFHSGRRTKPLSQRHLPYKSTSVSGKIHCRKFHYVVSTSDESSHNSFRFVQKSPIMEHCYSDKGNKDDNKMAIRSRKTTKIKENKQINSNNNSYHNGRPHYVVGRLKSENNEAYPLKQANNFSLTRNLASVKTSSSNFSFLSRQERAMLSSTNNVSYLKIRQNNAKRSVLSRLLDNYRACYAKLSSYVLLRKTLSGSSVYFNSSTEASRRG